MGDGEVPFAALYRDVRYQIVNEHGQERLLEDAADYIGDDEPNELEQRQGRAGVVRTDEEDEKEEPEHGATAQNLDGGEEAEADDEDVGSAGKDEDVREEREADGTETENV